MSFGEGSIALSTGQPLSNALPVEMKFSLGISSTASSDFNIAAVNYMESFFYRPLAGVFVAAGNLNIGFNDSTGQTTYGISTVDVSNAPVGTRFKFSSNISVFRAAPSTKNFFFVEFPAGSQGDFEFNLISCFPPIYKNRSNGARIDIAQAFSGLKLGLVRLPGGADLVGLTVPERFIWNNTIASSLCWIFSRWKTGT